MSEDKKRVGGRPLSINPKSKITHTRFSEEEHQIIKQKAEKLNVSVSEYMRESALNVKILEKRDTKEIQVLQAQIRKIGVNMNQVARKVNDENTLYSIIQKELEKIGDKLGIVIREL